MSCIQLMDYLRGIGVRLPNCSKPHLFLKTLNPQDAFWQELHSKQHRILVPFALKDADAATLILKNNDDKKHKKMDQQQPSCDNQGVDGPPHQSSSSWTRTSIASLGSDLMENSRPRWFMLLTNLTLDQKFEDFVYRLLKHAWKAEGNPKVIKAWKQKPVPFSIGNRQIRMEYANGEKF